MTTYTVMPGNTMWGIASKQAIGLNELLEANPQIKKSSFIFPGQKINIPNGTKSTYTVAPGDTMWNIAKKQGVELSKLIAANPQITNSSLIIPGQKVNIPDETTTSDDVRSLETEVIRLVNEERRRAGRPALVENSELSRIGRIKSNDFISNNYFSHNSPTYGTPFDMLRSFGISFTAAAENIAKGQGTATDVMNTWMNSQGHRANILNTTYNQIGVGVARDNNGVLYWTQMFIRS